MAFQHKDFVAITREIDEMAGRCASHFKNHLTHDDLLNTFVKKDHRLAAVQGVEVFGHSGHGSFQTKVTEPEHDRVTVTIEMNEVQGVPSFMVPRYMGTYQAKDGPALAKLEEFVRREGEHDREWELVKATFSALDDVCETPQELRYFWPPIVALLKGTDVERLNKLAAKVTEFKVPKRIPALHPALKECCLSTQRSTGKALMLKRVERREPIQVHVGSCWKPDRLPWADPVT